MFTTRLISGIILVILSLLIVGKGGALLFVTSAAISAIGLFELYRVTRMQDKLLGAVGYAAACAYYLLLWFEQGQYITLVAIAALMLFMTIYVVTFPKYGTEQVTVAFFGIFYVAVMFSYLYQVRMMADGKYLVWLIFLSSWGCDTCAYCVGVLFGKHKLAPVLSPKKSIEGAVGGVAGAALLGLLYGMVFREHMVEVTNAPLACALACGIASVISQIGDLAASAIKRNHGVKDYGHLIPGHGGVLDRFDSMLFTAPAIFFALTFLK
ncbi:MAG: phosphatidate cytidylyltransferase [Lachnospiraceae bacterium]|nr:phosphatidate cytidylyltransferase [Lachnospiraceae bacterium]